jgi:hypothetical protein
LFAACFSVIHFTAPFRYGNGAANGYSITLTATHFKSYLVFSFPVFSAYIIEPRLDFLFAFLALLRGEDGRAACERDRSALHKDGFRFYREALAQIDCLFHIHKPPVVVQTVAREK